jgi:hypothetical protein
MNTTTWTLLGFSPSLLVDVDMTTKNLTSQLVIVEIDMVKVELAKCKLDHKWELGLVYLEHANEVQGLKVRWS